VSLLVNSPPAFQKSIELNHCNLSMILLNKSERLNWNLSSKADSFHEVFMDLCSVSSKQH
jgi:hypothetical protein